MRAAWNETWGELPCFCPYIICCGTGREINKSKVTQRLDIVKVSKRHIFIKFGVYIDSGKYFLLNFVTARILNPDLY